MLGAFFSNFTLNVSGTSINNLNVLKSLEKIEVLKIENTSVKSLVPLEGKNSLKFIYADGSGIGNEEAFNLVAKTPGCTIIFKSEIMRLWWDDLPEAWKDYFSGSFKLNSPPSTEQLHGILLLESLEISDQYEIVSLSPLSMLLGLKTLKLTNLQISDISVLFYLSNLNHLECTRMPLFDLSPLSGLTNLTDLNIKNTIVSDLKPISSLDQMKSLIISGTHIKTLKPLSNFINLEQIELNNTPVKAIKPLLPLSQLNSVECYNTKISLKNIERFKLEKPDCKVVYY